MVGAKRLESWHIEAAPKLRLVLNQGVGYHYTVATTSLRDRQIPLAITPRVTPEGVAEPAIMIILAAVRRLAWQAAELRASPCHSHPRSAQPTPSLQSLMRLSF